MNETLQRKVVPTDASRLPANSNRFAGMRLFRRRGGQLGSIIVEMAMCMPVMILLVFGCLELNSSIFLSQTLTSAAHEGALVGLRQNATEDEVVERVATIMNSRNISGYTVDVKTFGTSFDSLASGEKFAIFIEAPRSNSFISLSEISAEVTAQRP